MTDEQIEQVARDICVGLGLNPEDSIGCGYGDDQTPGERAANTSTFIPDIMLFMPRWRLYRGKAAEAIAAHEAVGKLP